MKLSRKAQMNPAMYQAETLPSRSPRSDLIEQIDCSLLKHPGSDSVFNILAAAAFDHDRVDTPQMKQVGEQEPSRPASNDRDLGTHSVHASSQTSRAVSTTSSSFAFS
jgi:hypothetical protein